MCGAPEGLAALVDALGAKALPAGRRDGAGAAGHQCASNRPSAGRAEETGGAACLRRTRRSKAGTLLKHLIPLRTDHWQEKLPGFAEVDLVSHSGNSARGEFAYSLNLTDVHTGWTETRAILGKGRQAVLDALQEIQAALPFPLRGINSDNGSEFINWHVGSWCAHHQVQFSHSRPYKKDDNAYIEQKNWTHVRKLMGWDRKSVV